MICITKSAIKSGKYFVINIFISLIICEFTNSETTIPHKPSQIIKIIADTNGNTNKEFIKVKTEISPNSSSIFFEVTFIKNNISRIGISTFLSNLKDEKIEVCLKELDKGDSMSVGIVIPKRYLTNGLIETAIDGVTYRIHPIARLP